MNLETNVKNQIQEYLDQINVSLSEQEWIHLSSLDVELVCSIISGIKSLELTMQKRVSKMLYFSIKKNSFVEFMEMWKDLSGSGHLDLGQTTTSELVNDTESVAQAPLVDLVETLAESPSETRNEPNEETKDLIDFDAQVTTDRHTIFDKSTLN
jgi:hypothetical protein